MVLDGFLVGLLVNELQEKIIKSKLIKVKQISGDSFLFIFSNLGKKVSLMINLDPNNTLFYETNKSFEHQVYSTFFNQLKSNLEQGIVINFYQYQTDRVVVFELIRNNFIYGEINYKLIFEIMGRHANLIIIKDDLIVDAYKTFVSQNSRSLYPRVTYQFFESNKKPFDNINYEEILVPGDLQMKYQGVSKRLSIYLFNQKVQIKNIIIKPTAYQDFVYGFPIDNNSQIIDSNQSLSLLIDNFEEVVTLNIGKYETFINQALLKGQTKLSNLVNDLEAAKLLIEYKEVADDIYTNYQLLKNEVNYYFYNNKTYEFAHSKTLNEHAQDLYKKYRKGIRSLKPIEEQIVKTKELVNELQYMKANLEAHNQTDLLDLEQTLLLYGYKKHKKQVNRKTKVPLILKVNYKDSIIYIGKNAVQNAYITFTLGSKNDYWFHIKDYPGSHVLLKTTTLTNDLIEACATLAIHFSSFKNESSASVNYTTVKNVAKISGLNPSTVKIKDHHTIIINYDKQRANALLLAK